MDGHLRVSRPELMSFAKEVPKWLAGKVRKKRPTK